MILKVLMQINVIITLNEMVGLQTNTAKVKAMSRELGYGELLLAKDNFWNRLSVENLFGFLGSSLS